MAFNIGSDFQILLNLINDKTEYEGHDVRLQRKSIYFESRHIFFFALFFLQKYCRINCRDELFGDFARRAK